MSPSHPPSIITGGSVSIGFDQSAFGDASQGRYTNADKVTERVEITGTGIQNYDLSATGHNVTVKIIHGNS